MYWHEIEDLAKMRLDDFSPNARAGILDLAKQAQIAEVMLQDALSEFENSTEPDALVKFDRACEVANNILEPIVRQLVQFTPNSFVTYQFGFGPRCKPHDPLDFRVWLRTLYPAQFLECLAQYGSLSQRYWRSQGWTGFVECWAR